MNTASQNLPHHLGVLRERMLHPTDYELALNYFLEEFAGDVKLLDASEPDDAPQLLAVLSRYNIKATFFLVGKMAEKNPDLVKAEVAAGHIVGAILDDTANGVVACDQMGADLMGVPIQVVVACQPGPGQGIGRGGGSNGVGLLHAAKLQLRRQHKAGP